MKKEYSQMDSAWSGAVQRAFGFRVKTLRVQLAVSQEEFGLRCGLNPSYVGQVERGERNLSLESICRIADGLRISPSTLLLPLEGNLRPGEQD